MWSRLFRLVDERSYFTTCTSTLNTAAPGSDRGRVVARSRRRCLLAKEQFQEVIALQLGVFADGAEDAVQGADLDGIVRRHGEMVLARLLGGQANVAARLVADGVAELAERANEISAAHIARQFHAAINSSRT